jgi:TPR repeat protein
MAAPRNAVKDKRAYEEALKSARLGTPEAEYEVGLMVANGLGTAQNIAQAVDWIRRAAKHGLASAQFLLATRYENGVGVEQSASQALLWFSRAAEQGHMKAVFRMGKLLASAHPQDAADYYRSAAAAGQAEGQYALAKAYADGAGLARDGVAAAHWYRAAAEQGLATAQYALAQLLVQGHSVALDREEALHWYRKAAGHNHVAAQVAIVQMELAGEIKARGQGRSKRKPSAPERRGEEVRWVRAAEAGNADARYHLGLMYELGLGLEADGGQAQRWYQAAAQAGHAQAQLALARLLERRGNHEAVGWYRRAAQQGEAQAQFAMGRMCCAGELLTQDFLQGLSWYVKAAEQGHTTALVTLGNVCNGDLQHIATVCFTRAAEAGSAQAQYLLGQQYAQGKGLAKNLEQAFLCYERAAQQGLAEAEAALGVAYRNGLGTDKDFKQAFHWLQKAAEQGNAQAQWNLGAIYASGGSGVKQDMKQAFVWCQRAADQGFVAAQANLGVLYALLRNPRQAVVWWQTAAEQDDPEALYNLALAVLKGEGLSADAAKGLELLHRAAVLGVTPAQSRLGIMYASGDGVAQDPIEAHKWFAIAAAHGDAAARSNLQRSQSLCAGAQVTEAMRRVASWERGRAAAPVRP